MVDVVTLGETMAVFQPADNLAIRMSRQYVASIAGAESNVAIGLARLGNQTRWVSAVGADEFGEMITNTLTNEKVDTSFVTEDTEHSSAVFFKSFKGYGETNVLYYRKNGAASHLANNLADLTWLDEAKILHLTGITMALSSENAAYVIEVAKAAKAKGVKVSFDPNLRLKLWSVEAAQQWIQQILPYCDWYFPSREELITLHGEKKATDILGEYGLECVIVKEGLGAHCVTRELVVDYQGEAAPLVVDTAGAGDAFVTGVLHEFLQAGANLSEQLKKDSRFIRRVLETGHTMGKVAIGIKGDWENLPNRKELSSLLDGRFTDNR